MTGRDLAGTVALVTGASSGIGEATARVLAGLGASVGLVARRRDRLESLTRELESGGAAALAVEADLTERERAQRAVAAVVERFGRLDMLVNNAGVMLVEPGAVDTELRGHNRPEIQQALAARFGNIERLESEDVADAIAYVVTRPRRVAINEILVRPTEQRD